MVGMNHDQTIVLATNYYGALLIFNWIAAAFWVWLGVVDFVMMALWCNNESATENEKSY